MSLYVSWLIALLSSDEDPLLNTRTLRASPDDRNAARSPSTSAKAANRTTTVSAMPMAVITVVVRRTMRLRRLYVSGIPMISSLILNIEEHREFVSGQPGARE